MASSRAAGEPQRAAAAPRTRAVGVVRVDTLEELRGLDQRAAEAAVVELDRRLVQGLGAGQPAVRLGPAAFAAFLRDPLGVEAISRQVRALRYVLGQEVRLDALSFTPALKTGVAVFQGEGETAQDLLRRAEASAGGVQDGEEPVQFFSSVRRDEDMARFRLKQDLRCAIAEDQLELHYQPVIDLAANRVVSAEALLRWRRPDGRLTPPGEFVPLLEETALVEEVGRWILNTACRQLRSWAAAGLPELKVAVNLSARQFRDPRLAEVVARTLELHGVAPHALEVELTETAAMQDARRTAAVLGELKALGVGVAIDDFGSGYSSLSYLRTLPFSKLKIDREFVTDVDTRRGSRAICKAVIELARGLDMSILAEGAERMEEVDTLVGLGCPLFQGFYFSRPLEPDVFAGRVADTRWLDALASPVHRRLADLRRRVA